MKKQLTQQILEDRIQELKQQAHDRLRLYIELGAQDLAKKLDLSEKNLPVLNKAMKAQLLEGDQVLSKPKSDKGLQIRYYVDHLGPTRLKKEESVPADSTKK